MSDEEIQTGVTIYAGGGLALRDESDMAAFVQQSVLQWKAYQALTIALLDESDYQQIGQRRFKKKSAWRKYARAFNISCEKLSEEIIRDEQAWPIYARVVVRATTPDGRYQDGEQECHIKERCCIQPCSKRNWRNHFCCKAECNGHSHFSHPGDIPATAFTRAKNRAISDLIGAGEVSADEMKEESLPTDVTGHRPGGPEEPMVTHVKTADDKPKRGRKGGDASEMPNMRDGDTGRSAHVRGHDDLSQATTARASVNGAAPAAPATPDLPYPVCSEQDYDPGLWIDKDNEQRPIGFLDGAGNVWFREQLKAIGLTNMEQVVEWRGGRLLNSHEFVGNVLMELTVIKNERKNHADDVIDDIEWHTGNVEEGVLVN